MTMVDDPKPPHSGENRVTGGRLGDDNVRRVDPSSMPMRRRRPEQEIELTEEEVAEQYHGEQLDPLDELMAYDSDKKFVGELDMSQFGFRAPWTIQNLTGEQHAQLYERSSKVIKNTGNGTLSKQVDPLKFQSLIVAYGVQSPNHRHKDVFGKYKLKPTQEERLVQTIYKNQPGLLVYVSNAVLELSGFHEDLIEVAKSSD
jgi:hypothetical protein